MAQSLPVPLEELRLEFATSSATSEGGNAVFRGLFSRVTLENLRVLEMNDCLLSCQIPPEIGLCVALEELTLAGNKMCGEIPAEIGDCLALRQVRSARRASPSPRLLPPPLCPPSRRKAPRPPFMPPPASPSVHAPPASQVRCQNNRLTGRLPEELGRCPLELVRLNGNQLSGELPATLGDCLELYELRIQNNKLSGAVGARGAGTRG